MTIWISVAFPESQRDLRDRAAKQRDHTMRRAMGVPLLALGAAIAFVGGAAFVGANESPSREVNSPADLLEAERAIETSQSLKKLADGRQYEIISTGDWHNVGELAGTASIIRFTETVTLDGALPIMNVKNAVSEAERSAGVPEPDQLDIEYRLVEGRLTASEFSVLVDLDGAIRSVTAVPERAPALAPPKPGEQRAVPPSTNPPALGTGTGGDS